MPSNKFIFLCAGMGSRLMPMTKLIPKSMVQIGGKSLLLHNIDHLISLGIKQSDIILMGGYKHHRLPTQFSKIINPDFHSSNMVETLYYYYQNTQDFDKSDAIHIIYGDCLFTHKTLEQILGSPVKNNCIELPVDLSWKEKWSSRYENIYEDAETLIYDQDNKLIQIGLRSSFPCDYMAQFMGYIILNGVSTTFLFSYLRNLSDSVRRNLSSTELIQNIAGISPVYVRPHSFNWYEVDNFTDLEYASTCYI